MPQNHLDTIQTAATLASDLERRFLDLGRLLREAREQDKKLFKSLLALPSLDRRTAYYLVAISETFGPLHIDKGELIKVGWTKLATIRAFVTDQNAGLLLDLAHQHSNYALRRLLAGKAPGSEARVVLLYLQPKEYKVYRQSILAFGAKPVGRQLRGQEEALMKLIANIKTLQK